MSHSHGIGIRLENYFTAVFNRFAESQSFGRFWLRDALNITVADIEPALQFAIILEIAPEKHFFCCGHGDRRTGGQGNDE